jgi:Domain of unknown function (DUF6484)
MKARSTLRRGKGGSESPVGLRRSRSVPVPPSGLTRALSTTVGRLVGVGPKGEPYLDLPAQRLTAVVARSIVALSPAQVGDQVLVSFADNDRGQPVVLGLLHNGVAVPTAPAARTDALLDGERIILTGEKEVVLRCGKASIALSADGKVVIKGAKLLAAASGLHRIRGGAVQIN